MVKQLKNISEKNGVGLIEYDDGKLVARFDGMELSADFDHLKKRIAPNVLQKELLVRAAKLKNMPKAISAEDLSESALKVKISKDSVNDDVVKIALDVLIASKRPLAIDATAGLGEDAFLLAAAGFEVMLFEHNLTIFALLQNAIEMAQKDEDLAPIAAHMHLFFNEATSFFNSWFMHLQLLDVYASFPNSDGVTENVKNNETFNKTEDVFTDFFDNKHPSIIYLDPMFATKTKTAAAKKKFQILHELEEPPTEEDQAELFLNAANLNPKKIIVKRPLKGKEIIADKSPGYSLKGKAIRYDCYVFA